MADSDWLALVFEEHRDHLRAVAYRLLGSTSDADDAVQDSWLRLNSTDVSEVENLGGWLTTVVARVALNLLRSRRNRHEEPVGDSWPSTAETAAATGSAAGTAAGLALAPAPAGNPEDEAVLADSVGLAMLVVLDTLTPAERIAFVLHDLFAMPFTQVAAVLGRSPEATRQLASRARRRVRGAPSPDHPADLTRQREVTEAFLAATRQGDFDALVALLDSEVTLTSDAAAAPAGRPLRLRGLEVVAKGAIASGVRAQHSRLALVDGQAGIVFAPAGRLQVVLILTVSAERKVTTINVMADPGRLRELRLSLIPG